MSKKKVCIILPCYRVKDKIYTVYKKLIKTNIDCLIFVDDNCPQNSGKYLKSKTKKNRKTQFIFLKKNLGVGGATLKGFESAHNQGFDILIKFDADNQHKINDLIKIIKKLNQKNVDFCKGYRDLNLKSCLKRGMPIIRTIGANVLTFLSRITSKNSNLKDVTNGLFGMKSNILKKINVKNLKKDYFFEQDIIFRVCQKKIKIFQVNSEVVYDNENSSLSAFGVIIPFFINHIRNFFYKN
jgi:GT2 family glycosyltransferase